MMPTSPVQAPYYHRQDQPAQRLQLENEDDERTSQPLLWPDPDIPLQSVETDYDFDGIQLEFDPEEAEEVTQLRP